MSDSLSPRMNPERRDWLAPWHVNASSNKNYDVIDGLRGIAILLVVTSHCIYINPVSSSLVKFVAGVFGAGNGGVNVFFIISGFLISLPFWKKKAKGGTEVTPKGYGWRRFYKIYPPLALSVLILTPLYIVWFKDLSYIGLAMQWLLGIPLVLPVSGRLNPVMWSLVVEVQFYLVLPVIFICLSRASFKVCLLAIPLILFVAGQVSGWMCAINGIQNTINPQINFHFPSMLDAFTGGVLLAGLETYSRGLSKKWVKLGDVGLVLLPIVQVSTSWFRLHPTHHPYVQDLVLFTALKAATVFLLCYIADPQNPRARLLSHPVLRWFGIISFEWYLFHQPIVIWARVFFGPAGGNIIKYGFIVGGSMAAGLIIAAVIYKYFSLPILRSGRSRHTR